MWERDLGAITRGGEILEPNRTRGCSEREGEGVHGPALGTGASSDLVEGCLVASFQIDLEHVEEPASGDVDRAQIGSSLVGLGPRAWPVVPGCRDKDSTGHSPTRMILVQCSRHSLSVRVPTMESGLRPVLDSSCRSCAAKQKGGVRRTESGDWRCVMMCLVVAHPRKDRRGRNPPWDILARSLREPAQSAR